MESEDPLSTPIKESKKRGREDISETPEGSPDADKGKGRAKEKEIDDEDEGEIGPPVRRGKAPLGKGPKSIKAPAGIAIESGLDDSFEYLSGLSAIGIEKGTPAYATSVKLTGNLYNALCARLIDVYNGEVSCAYRFSARTASPKSFMFSKYLSANDRTVEPLSLDGVVGTKRLTKVARHFLDNVLLGASVPSDGTLSLNIPGHRGFDAETDDVSVVFMNFNPMVIVDHGAFSGSSSFYQSRGVLLGAVGLASEDRTFISKYVEPLLKHLVDEGINHSKFVCVVVALSCTPVVSKYKRGTMSDPEYVRNQGQYLDESSLWGGCVEPPAPLYFTRVDGSDTAKTDIRSSSIIRTARIPFFRIDPDQISTQLHEICVSIHQFRVCQSDLEQADRWNGRSSTRVDREGEQSILRVGLRVFLGRTRTRSRPLGAQAQRRELGTNSGERRTSFVQSRIVACCGY